MNSWPRDFLMSIRPPYFDAFYFQDEEMGPATYIYPHVFYKIILFLQGDITYSIGERQYDMIPGDILLPPRHMHYYSRARSHQPYHRLVIWFTPELLDSIDPSGELKSFFEQISQQEGTRFHFRHELQNQIFENAITLASELDYTKSMKDAVAYSLVALILAGIYRGAADSTSGPSDSVSAQLVQSVADHINEHLTDNLSLENIAETFFVSKYHLERIFKKHMSITLHSYIIQRRLTLARQKLYGGALPTTIYKLCGFSNYSTFYRAFQKLYGISPKQFSEHARGIMYKDVERSGEVSLKYAEANGIALS